ncbi:MAG: hypothetical protein KDB22_17840 [Planctomycetales bacterium]|nr:hypothetical protein [Planctomycetales bacterium]
MPSIELSIGARFTAPLETVAWYLPGDDTICWLDEISLWPIDHSSIKLMLIHESDSDCISGLLAIPLEAVPNASGWCVPFGRFSHNVYLPVQAELTPVITTKEMLELFPGDDLYVWLPGRGLRVARSADLMGVADLLQLPADQGIDWSLAVPGMAFPSRLSGIFPSETPSSHDVIEMGRDGIGEQVGEIEDLPRSPAEPLFGAARRAVLAGAVFPVLGLTKLMSAVGNLMPGGQRPATHGQGRGNAASAGLAKLAGNMVRKLTESLEAKRHQAVGRLLNMLESDPDQGLKYAIPFRGAGSAHRGQAAPGSQLGARNVDFSLSQLGGGGPADHWNLSSDYQRQLVTKYRELAARELRLGRHRRAAYIYAELLGDLRSAASTLEQGRHFREAAVLYREQLQDLSAAAECLERGELWNEAIEAYLDLKRYEKVGDLCTVIEHHEAAADAYHAAVEELKGKFDFLGAARIYEHKLNDCRCAVETLDRGWPDSSQAERCVEAGFALRGRLGWHDEAKERVAELVAQMESHHKYSEVAELLANVFNRYPSRDVQQAAGKLARDLVFNRMQSAKDSEARQLVSVLGRLDPNDRLLLRDGSRFLEKRSSATLGSRTIDKFQKKQLQLIRRARVGLPGDWQTAVSLGDLIVIAGVVEGRIAFARVDYNRVVDKNLSVWPKISVASNVRLQMFGNQSRLSIFAIGQQQLPEAYVFPAAQGQGNIMACTPRGLDVVWGTAIGKLGHIWAVANRQDPVLVCVDGAGAVVSTQSLLSALDASWHTTTIPIPMHAVDDRVLLGIGNELLSVRAGKINRLEVLPSRVIALSGGSPYAAPILAASMEQGVAVVKLGFDGYVEQFANELMEPAVLLSRGGFAIAADQHAVQAYEIESGRLFKCNHGGYSAEAESMGTPIAILPAERTNRFTVVTENGVVSVYQING